MSKYEMWKLTKLALMRVFLDMTSANSNSSTLWHGMDEILNNEIPEFLQENITIEELENRISKILGKNCQHLQDNRDVEKHD